MMSSPKHSTPQYKPSDDAHMWPELDLSSLEYGYFLNAAHTPFHPAIAAFDQTAASWDPAVSESTVLHEINEPPLSRDNCNLQTVPNLGSSCYSMLSGTELSSPETASQRTTPPFRDSEPILSEISSPDTISTCALSVQTPNEVQSLQIRQYNPTKLRSKVVRKDARAT